MSEPLHPLSPSVLPLVVGISGASGAVYGIRLLQALRDLSVPSHLIMSHAAEVTLAQETDLTADEVKSLASIVHDPADIGAAPSSGSFRTLGMVIAPCSIHTMSEIASGVTASLLSRAADVTLKERRRLVLMVRETPLHTGHLRTMTMLSELGAIIAPPLPAFYTHPTSISDLVDQSVGRILDLFGLESGHLRRWTGIAEK